MQPLSAPPRNHLTDAQVYRLLTGPRARFLPGLELLDSANRVVEDITGELVGGSVEHDGREVVHGSCALQIQRELAWGRDRLRPYLTVSNGSLAARFNLGVFLLTTPTSKVGENPVTWDVDGYDLLHLLDTPVGDTYVAEVGVGVLAAVAAAVEAAVPGATVLLDGTANEAVLDAPMVWALTESSASTWLTVVNDLLAAVGYRGMWADENGAYRSEPDVPPAVAAISWVFRVTDPETTIVGPDRVADEDVWGKSNRWTFIRRGMTTRPVEGDGIYIVQNLTVGASSRERLGRVVPRPPVFLDAADQASLVAQGDRIVAEDMGTIRTISLDVDPLPIVGHLDVVQINDTAVDRAVVISSTVNLDGSRGKFVFEAVA